MNEKLVYLIQQNRDCLTLITQYIESTPWCEEGQDAYDATGTLLGFFDAFDVFLPKLIQRVSENE